MGLYGVILWQEIEHIRQHAGNNGEIFQELGADCRREDRPTARGEATNRRATASDVARVSYVTCRDVIVS